MPREPLLLPALSVASGVLLASLAGLPLLPYLAVGLAALAALTLAILYRRLSHLRWPLALVALFCTAAASFVWHQPTHTPKLDADDGDTVILSGCISNPPVFSPDRAQFTLDLKPDVSARVTVNMRSAAPLDLRYGQPVELTAAIRKPRNFGNPGAFDYAAYLAGQHIYWNASVANPSDLKTLPGSCGSPAFGVIYAMRTWALNRLARLYPDDRHTSALLAATLLGETAGMEKRWTEDFRITGTFHAIVISGQQVSVLAGTLLALLGLLQAKRLHAMGAATAVCWCYALVSGFSAPVVRAAGGFTIFLCVSYLFRRQRTLNVLSLLAIVYLLLAPSELFDPSFQLSFLSALAIALFAVPLLEKITGPMRASVKRFDQPREALRMEPKAAQWRVEWLLLAETIRAWTGLSQRLTDRLMPVLVSVIAYSLDAMAISACVEFALALPMIIYFHRLSITGLSANIVVIPLLGLVVPLGFLAIFTMWTPVAVLARITLNLAEAVASWHARFEPSYRIAAVPFAVAIAFAAALIMVAYAARKRPDWTPLPLAAALALFALLCLQPWKPDLSPHRLEVTAIDVGQGDSILVVFPNGKTMLVDAGGFPGFGNMKHKPQMDIGEDVVSPYLWSRRLHSIDIAVLTHGHSDHMGGLPAILDNFHPRTLWIGAEPVTDEWRNVEAHAAKDHVAITPLHRGVAPFDFGGAQVRILSPTADYAPLADPKNNDSLVFDITYGHQRVLFTGDAEREVEAELVSSGQLQPVTLLKVGHHGSKTSSTDEFLSLLQPKYAFISDGYMNHFHHPHPTVLARLADHGVDIRRTDQRGLETFSTDGQSVQVHSFHALSP